MPLCCIIQINWKKGSVSQSSPLLMCSHYEKGTFMKIELIPFFHHPSPLPVSPSCCFHHPASHHNLALTIVCLAAFL